MVNEAKIDTSIKEKLKHYPKALDVFNVLLNDKEVNKLLEIANDVAINRLRFNDHGKIHSKIVLDSSLKLLNLLKKKPKQESVIAIVLGAYLHDIGMSINRKDHEIIGMNIARPIMKRIHNNLKVISLASEAILCHMGNYKPTSMEAGIVSVADGTDLTAGRARMTYRLGMRKGGATHQYSALSILNVSIKKGNKKPVQIEVLMKNPAGIFQVEEILLTKLKNSELIDKISVIANIKKGQKTEESVIS